MWTKLLSLDPRQLWINANNN